jgi:hypothetical protein
MRGFATGVGSKADAGGPVLGSRTAWVEKALSPDVLGERAMPLGPLLPQPLPQPLPGTGVRSLGDALRR